MIASPVIVHRLQFPRNAPHRLASDAKAQEAQVHHQNAADQERQPDQVNDFKRRDQRCRMPDRFSQESVLQPFECREQRRGP